MSATQTKANKNKATHSGSCQACGAQQKLPGGVLAKHGYTTKWGFFSGTCQGSGSQAFEVSCDLIERFIAWAEQKRAVAAAFRDSLLLPPTEAKGWMRLYRSATRYGVSSGYYWVEVEMAYQNDVIGERTYTTAKFLNPDNNRWEGLYQRGMYGVDDSTGILAWVASANQKRAAAVADEIAKIEEYIRWQQKRVAEWKPGTLTPVGA